MNLESLKKQLTEAEASLEQAKAMVYRSDGVVATLKYVIAEMEKPEEPNSPNQEPKKEE